jgi:hypothetical protein
MERASSVVSSSVSDQELCSLSKLFTHWTSNPLRASFVFAPSHWAFTNVSLGIACVDAVAYSKKFEIPTSSVTIAMAWMAVCRITSGSFAPTRVPIPPTYEHGGDVHGGS